MSMKFRSLVHERTLASPTGSPVSALSTKPSSAPSDWRVRTTSARSLTHTYATDTMLSFAPNDASWLASTK